MKSLSLSLHVQSLLTSLLSVVLLKLSPELSANTSWTVAIDLFDNINVRKKRLPSQPIVSNTRVACTFIFRLQTAAVELRSIIFCRAIVGAGVGQFQSKTLRIHPNFFRRFRNATDRWTLIGYRCCVYYWAVCLWVIIRSEIVTFLFKILLVSSSLCSSKRSIYGWSRHLFIFGMRWLVCKYVTECRRQWPFVMLSCSTPCLRKMSAT